MTDVRKWISGLREGAIFKEVYYCVVKSDPTRPTPTTRNPDPQPYVSAVLVDKTGRIGAYIWDESQWARFEAGDYVEVRGEVRGSGARRRLKVIEIHDAGKRDPADFIRHTYKDLELLLGKFEARLAAVGNPGLRRLLGALVDRYGEQLTLMPFVQKGVPGNYWGGLLVMLDRVLDQVDAECEEDPGLDHDLMVAGAVLAGCGKVRSFDLGVNETQLSVEGGALAEGDLCQILLAELVHEAGEVPDDVLLAVRHCIAARRGKEGLPSGFQTAEAELVLHIWEYVVKVKHALERRTG